MLSLSRPKYSSAGRNAILQEHDVRDDRLSVRIRRGRAGSTRGRSRKRNQRDGSQKTLHRTILLDGREQAVCAFHENYRQPCAAPALACPGGEPRAGAVPGRDGFFGPRRARARHRPGARRGLCRRPLRAHAQRAHRGPQRRRRRTSATTAATASGSARSSTGPGASPPARGSTTLRSTRPPRARSRWPAPVRRRAAGASGRCRSTPTSTATSTPRRARSGDGAAGRTRRAAARSGTRAAQRADDRRRARVDRSVAHR